MPPEQRVEEAPESFERGLIVHAELQLGAWRGVWPNGEQCMCGRERADSGAPTEFERFVPPHAIGEIFDNEDREVRRDEKLLNSSARRGALQIVFGTLNCRRKGALCKCISPNDPIHSLDRHTRV